MPIIRIIKLENPFVTKQESTDYEDFLGEKAKDRALARVRQLESEGIICEIEEVW